MPRTKMNEFKAAVIRPLDRELVKNYILALSMGNVQPINCILLPLPLPSLSTGPVPYRGKGPV